MTSFINVHNWSDTLINNSIAQFRVNRNIMLQKTDALIMPDRNPDSRYTQFRQKLRDIPQNQPQFIFGLDDDYFTEWEWDMFAILGAGMMD
tara:strand:- start:1154 stop:1426 length:273 start_codon:yes stop_codon:yes gene_type:complete